jgi:hypothetical protein
MSPFGVKLISLWTTMREINVLRKFAVQQADAVGKLLPDHGFQPPRGTPQKAAIWSYASRKGFVIRCPLANMCIAHSSVAQR